MPFSFCFRLTLMCLSILLAQGYKGKTPTLGPPGPAFNCCGEVYKDPIPANMKACWIQREYQTQCDIAAYIFIGARNAFYCVDPEASWLQETLEKWENETGKKCRELHQPN